MIRPVTALRMAAFVLASQSLPAQAAYEQIIRYEGMQCSSIQRDSIAYPANEIFIHAHVTDHSTGRVAARSLPSSGGTYRKVVPGFRARGGDIIWRGAQTGLSVRISMWEHDEGGKNVGAFSRLLTSLAISAKGGGKTPGRIKDANDLGPGDDPFSRALSRGIGGILGTDHDLIGYQRVYLGKRDHSTGALRKTGSFTYHFATTHRRGGANCQAYFRVYRGRQYQDRPPQQVRQSAPAPRATPAPYSEPQLPGTLQTDHQSIEAGRQQCQAVYEDCHYSTQSCQSNHNSRYKNCAANMKRRLEQCLSRFPLLRSNLNSGRPVPTSRQQYRDKGACDAYRGTSGQCGPVNHSCGQTNQCLIARSHCLQRVENSAPPPGPGFEPPPPIVDRGPPPPPPRERGYRVYFKNSCDSATSVAYRYKNFDGEWITRGWSNLDAGKKVLSNIRTENPSIFVHATVGKIDGSSGLIRNRAVVNPPFEFTGSQKTDEDGARVMPFHHYEWRASKLDTTVRIANCDHSDKRYDPRRDRLLAAAGERLYKIAGTSAGRHAELKKFLDLGAPVDHRYKSKISGSPENGRTALFQLVKNRDADGLKLLKEYDADFSVVDDRKNGLFHIAVRPRINDPKFYPLLFDRLRAYGADINARDGSGKTPMQLAVRHRAQLIDRFPPKRARGDVPQLTYLLKWSKARINDQYDGGDTLLHIAAKGHYVDFARQLLKAGARTNIKNRAGKTALDYAALQGAAFQDLFEPRGKDVATAKPEPLPTAPVAGTRPLTEADKAMLEERNKARLEALNDRGTASPQ